MAPILLLPLLVGSSVFDAKPVREVERAFGEFVATLFRAQYGEVEDRLLLRWARGRASQVGRAFEGWRFEVYILDSAEANAISTPGGFVLLTWGLLREVRDDDELAGAIAHEMAHSTRHHVAKNVLKQAALSSALYTIKDPRYRYLVNAGEVALVLLALRDMRKSEYDADRHAAEACLKTGFDPLGLARLLSRISAEVKGWERFVATHPPTSRRVRAIEALRPKEPRGLCELASAFLRRGKVLSALRLFREARKKSPQFPPAIEGLALCRARLGDFEGAEEVVRSSPLPRTEKAKLLERIRSLREEFEPLRLPRLPQKRNCQKGAPKEALEEARRTAKGAKKRIEALSRFISRNQVLIEVATWRPRGDDWRWDLLYFEAAGLAMLFREALFAISVAADEVEEAASSPDSDAEHLRRASSLLPSAASSLERAHRAISPNLIHIASVSLFRSLPVTDAQLSMLQVSCLSAYNWLRESLRRARRAQEEASKSLLRSLEERLNSLASHLPAPSLPLACQLLSMRLGARLPDARMLLEEGRGLGTAALILATSEETGESPMSLSAALKGSGADLAEEKGVYAPDLLLALRPLVNDLREVEEAWHFQTQAGGSEP